MGRYTREEIDFWREKFKEINTNGDRYIEPYELIAAAKEDGFEMSDDEAKEWIAELDADHDGKVSFSEFIKAFGELKSNQ
ncbi:EF-hand [Aspergillus sergii]|uniref:EF-hand n=1 Tax=Aspergillus sergii TaxID=1034303 RepID=A0A5N6XK76_9EURO|nr:EF-hand [Aspergillus sergii]